MPTHTWVIEQFIWNIVRSGDLAALESALRYDPSLSKATGMNTSWRQHDSLIHFAAAEHPEAIPLLAKYGANLNRRKHDQDGSTPLNAALREEIFNSTAILL